MQGTQVTFVGNLTGDPETRFTPSGVSVTNFNVAVNHRVKSGPGTDDWKDGEPTFYRVAVWREYGEHVAESLSKGDQVLVIGKLIVRTWEGDDGAKRKELDVSADEIGPTLRWATAKLSKASRSNGGQGQSKGGNFNDEPPF
jgi:single-strand DNA-binding protein